jgi:hypothetical protein
MKIPADSREVNGTGTRAKRWLKVMLAVAPLKVAKYTVSDSKRG